MTQHISKIKIWIGMLTVIIFICIGMTGQASGKGRSNDQPEAVIKVSALSGKAPLTVQFNGRESSSPDGRIRSYLWDFGDRANSRGKIVNHTYDTPGSYIAELRVKDSNKEVDTDTVMIEVLPCYIHVEDMSIALINNEDGSVRAQVSVLITDDEKVPVEDVMVIGQWKGLVRGRSVGITDKNGKAVFESKSTVESGVIKFLVKSAGTSGCSYRPDQNQVRAIKISTETALNLEPSVSIKADSVLGIVPHSVNFCGADSNDSDGSIVSYNWDFGDGEYSNDMGDSHTYLEAGTYKAILTVVDDQGATASDSIIIIVSQMEEPMPGQSIILTDSQEENTMSIMVFSDNEELGNNGPVAEISAKCAGDGVINVNFDGGESYDPDGSVVSYSWSFGDGALGNGEIASHSFPSFGIYKVTLTIADDHGAIGSATIALEINSAGICYYRVVSSPSLIF